MAISLFDQDNNEKETSNQSNNLGGSRISNFSSGMNPSRAGVSGRFTNLKKYINANEDSGENIASRMGQAVDKSQDEYAKSYLDKASELSTGISDAQNLFNTQGTQFKQTLGNATNDLNTFKAMDDRDTFNQGSQTLFDFNKNSGTDFNKLRQGFGLNEQQLQQTQGLANQLATDQLSNIQRQQQGIQTEQGRYDLLKAARPKLGSYSSGQGRLDQLFFQTNPNAIGNLQNTFGQNLDKVKVNQANLGTIGNQLTDVINQEKILQGDLQTAANTAQDAFVKQLNQAKNFNQINQERTNLYNDYLNQLNTGQISGDLADMLGIRGLQTWNPVYVPRINPEFDGNIIQKITPIGGDVPSSPNIVSGDKFRTFNVLKDGGQNYIQQGNAASRFQDLLTQPDYDAYQALANLSGRDLGLASGVSQLGESVKANPNANLVNDIISSSDEFKTLADKNFQGMGGAARSWQQGNITGIGSTTQGGDAELFAQAGENLDHRAALQQILDSSLYGAGSTASALAQNNLNDYFYSGQYGPNSRITETNYGSFGDRASNTAAMDSAKYQARNSLNQYLDNLINQEGVKNVAEITDENTADKYKRFKGLV